MTLAPLVSPVRLRCEVCDGFFLGYDSDLCPDCENDPAALAELKRRQPPKVITPTERARKAAKQKYYQAHKAHSTEYHREYMRRRRSALAAKKGL